MGILTIMHWVFRTHCQPVICLCLGRPLPSVCPLQQVEQVPRYRSESLWLLERYACDSTPSALLLPRFSEHCWSKPWIHWSS